MCQLREAARGLLQLPAGQLDIWDMKELELIKRLGLPDEIVGPEDRLAEHRMDLLHVRRDNHKPQADPLPGALPGLWRHHVRDLEVALPADAQGLGALTGADDLPCSSCNKPGT